MRGFFVFCGLILMTAGPLRAETPALETVLNRMAADTSGQTEELEAEREALLARKKALEERLSALKRENGEKKKKLETLIAETRRMETERRSSELAGLALVSRLKEAEEGFHALLASSPTLPLFSLKMGEKMDLESLSAFFEALRQNLAACDTLSRESISFLGRDGRKQKGEVLRVGGLGLSGLDLKNRALFLVSDEKAGGYREAALSPSWLEGRDIRKVMQGEEGRFPLDLSRGLALSGNGGRRSLEATLREGGLLLWPILFIGLAGLGIFVVRGFVLFRLRFCEEETGHLVAMLQDGERGLRMEKEARIPALSVVALAVRLRHETALFREQAVEAEAAAWSDRMEKGLATLGVLAALAPMLGLLGTVTGMMASFRVMSQMGAGDVRLMSGGISEALITTQWGLGVAVPLLLAHHLLSRRAERLALEAEDRGMEALALLGKKEG